MAYEIIDRGDGTGDKAFECNKCGCVFIENECEAIDTPVQIVYITNCPVCNSNDVWRIPRILRDIYR